MVTDEQRRIATYAAQEREERHEAAGHDRGWVPNKFSGAETHRIGILGEFACLNRFGGSGVDLSFRPGGDDGADIIWRGIPIDVKVSTYTGPRQYLRVLVHQMHPENIYVAGIYDRLHDDVVLVKWEWGHELVRENHRVMFPPHRQLNYVKLYADCRSLDELLEI